MAAISQVFRQSGLLSVLLGCRPKQKNWLTTQPQSSNFVTPNSNHKKKLPLRSFNLIEGMELTKASVGNEKNSCKQGEKEKKPLKSVELYIMYIRPVFQSRWSTPRNSLCMKKIDLQLSYNKRGDESRQMTGRKMPSEISWSLAKRLAPRKSRARWPGSPDKKLQKHHEAKGGYLIARFHYKESQHKLRS